MQLLSWFQKPYPIVETFLQKLFLALIFGLFIYLFLVLFQPFNIQSIAKRQPLYTLGFGIITTIFMSFNYLLFPSLFPKLFQKEYWTVGKELLFLLFNIVSISFGNYYYHTFSVDPIFHTFQLDNFLFMTLAIGAFPVVFFIFLRELLRSKQLVEEAQAINTKRGIEKQKIKLPEIECIELKGETSNDYLRVELNQLLFAQSEGNYSKIHYQEKGISQTMLLRVSLKNLETQLEQYPSILRCHRSFIINKNNITHLSGNARSYLIHFVNNTATVPVSRSFPKEKLV